MRRRSHQGRCQTEIPSAVEALLTWCARGPRLATVDTVSVEELAPRYNQSAFTIRR